MNNKTASVSALWLCMFLILLAVVSRLLPHPPNFTPLAAVGLFAGASLGTRKFWLVPVTALLISDLIIGFYPPVVMAFVYSAFILCAYLGRALLYERRNIFRFAGATLSGSLIFFLLSNFGDWLSGMNYPLTPAGLLDCYVMAIPFYRNTLLGDLFYVACLFGTYAWCSRMLFNMRPLHTA